MRGSSVAEHRELGRRRRDYHRTAVAVAALCAALLSDTGCSRVEGGGEISRIEHLDLEAEGAAAGGRERTLALALEVPAEDGVWSVTGAYQRIVEHTEAGLPKRTLALAGKGPVRVRIPGSFDPSQFNSIVLDVQGIRSTEVHALLMRDDLPVIGSDLVPSLPPVGSSAGERRVEIAFSSLWRVGGAFDALEIMLQSSREIACEIGGIELWDIPAELRFPNGAGLPDLIAIDGDQRRGVALSAGRPLIARCEARSDAELRFSYAQPEIARTAGQKVLLRVELSGERGQKRTRSFTLELQPNVQSIWREARMSLASCAPGSVRVRFVLEAPQGANALCAVAEVRVARIGTQAPTVLLVTSDTHRADHVSALAPSGGARTPGIDLLASRGVLFEDCTSTTNLTNPSHVAMMTGLSPRDTRVIDNLTVLPDAAHTLAEEFRRAGWRTLAVVTADHLTHRGSGLGQGFDRMAKPFGGEEWASAAVARMQSWLDASPDEPVFAWVHVFDAHTPYVPLPEFVAPHWTQGDPFDPSLAEPAVPDSARAFMPPGLRNLDYMRALYRAEIASLDRALGELFAHPRVAAGIVALTGDHGESLGEHDNYYDHGGLYPQTIRVPLVIAWPGGPRGVRVQAPVQNLEVARTLLELAGIHATDFPGADLRRFVDDAGSPAAPRFALANDATSAAVTFSGWHLVLVLRRTKRWSPEGDRVIEAHATELYDLQRDPGCTRDLASSAPERAIRLRALLVAWLASAVELGWRAARVEDAEALEHLTQLGYSTDAAEVVGPWIDPACTCTHCEAFSADRH